MASEVDICNLAMARNGDEASVVSIDPPDGSAQAAHCARFYPMVRDALLQAHPWTFAKRRARMAERSELPDGVSGWAHSYALPSQCLRVMYVLPPDAADDELYDAQQEFSQETDQDGEQVVLTDCESAVAVYIRRVSDPTKFSPLFIEALSWRLAGAVAGPLIKGPAGVQQALRCEQMAANLLKSATALDSNQGRQRMRDTPPPASWLKERG